MALTADNYLRLLQQLLPLGSAWPRDPEAVLTTFLSALALELSRVDTRGDDLLTEADPRTTLELLTDWERVCALIAGDAPTGARRDAVALQLSAVGGASLAYFQGLADRYGYNVTLTEGPEPHVWRVTFTDIHVTYFTAGDSSSGDLLSDWSTTASIEGLFNLIKPAHTRLIIAYA